MIQFYPALVVAGTDRDGNVSAVRITSTHYRDFQAAYDDHGTALISLMDDKGIWIGLEDGVTVQEPF